VAGGPQVWADVMALAAITLPSSQVHPAGGSSKHVATALAIARVVAALVFLPGRAADVRVGRSLRSGEATALILATTFCVSSPTAPPATRRWPLRCLSELAS
jgi:hypothetical protein